MNASRTDRLGTQVLLCFSSFIFLQDFTAAINKQLPREREREPDRCNEWVNVGEKDQEDQTVAFASHRDSWTTQIFPQIKGKSYERRLSNVAHTPCGLIVI